MGFQQRINARIARAQGRHIYGNAPRKILDFRLSEIVSAAVSEYKARIPRIMKNRSPRTRGEHACKRSAVRKRDVDLLLRVLQDRLGNAKS